MKKKEIQYVYNLWKSGYLTSDMAMLEIGKILNSDKDSNRR